MLKDVVHLRDVVFFLLYEAIVVPAALVLTGWWQLAGAAAGVAGLGIARAGYRRRHPGSLRRPEDDPPVWLQAAVGIPLIGAGLIALQMLGADATLGWFMVAWGLYLNAQDPLSRAWARYQPRAA